MSAINLANYFQPLYPQILEKALTYAKAGKSLDSDIELAEAALSRRLKDEVIRTLSAPELNRFSSYFQWLGAFVKSHANLASEYLTLNHGSTMKQSILENLTYLQDADITVKTSQPIRQDLSRSGTETEGSVEFGQETFEFKAQRTYANGSSISYYDLLLTQPETGFTYHFNSTGQSLESKLGNSDFSINMAQKQDLEAVTGRLANAKPRPL